ncbi:ComF family protein, partial [Thermodesulfobacteriota bacterium]
DGTVHLKGKTIVLIDDVATTGSTVNECARVLKKAGVEKVYCLVLARTVKG